MESKEMFRPPSDLGNLESFADWLEACALYSEEGAISKATASDILRDEGLLGTSEGDYFEGDITYKSEISLSDEDSANTFFDDVWQILESRKGLLKEIYPFTNPDKQVLLRESSWEIFLSYSVLLLADLWRAYKLDSSAEGGFTRLFEKLVEAGERGLFGGGTVRFGVPVDEGWPKSINDRIRHLGDLLSLDVEELEGKTGPNDGDRGLDVAARLGLGDDGPGTIVLLTQCATGKHWREKTGELSIANWHDILRWNAVLVRAIAVPWQLTAGEKKKQFRKFDAVVIDRFRLLSGNPDRYLEEKVREELLAWCRDAQAYLPLLR